MDDDEKRSEAANGNFGSWKSYEWWMKHWLVKRWKERNEIVHCIFIVFFFFLFFYVCVCVCLSWTLWNLPWDWNQTPAYAEEGVRIKQTNKASSDLNKKTDERQWAYSDGMFSTLVGFTREADYCSHSSDWKLGGCETPRMASTF